MQKLSIYTEISPVMILCLEYLILFFVSKLINSKWSNLIYTWCPLFGNGHEMLWILQFFLLLSFIVNFINSSSEHCFSNCLFNSKLIHIRNIYIFFFFKIGWFWNYFCKGFLKPENSRSCNVKFLSSYRQVYVTFWKFKRKSDSF